MNTDNIKNNHTDTLSDEMLDQIQGGSVTAAAIVGTIAASVAANIIYDAAKKGIKAIIKHVKGKKNKNNENAEITVDICGAYGSW